MRAFCTARGSAICTSPFESRATCTAIVPATMSMNQTRISYLGANTLLGHEGQYPTTARVSYYLLVRCAICTTGVALPSLGPEEPRHRLAYASMCTLAPWQ